MPEGDTIWRTAARLRPALEGATLERFDAPRLVGDRPRVGETIDAVEAVGKHLLVRFSGGLVLDTHMRMTGSWHLYRSGERWRKPPYLARVTITVAGWVAVCFSAPVVRVRHERSSTPSPVAHLGPDLCAPEPDLDDAVARMAQLHGPSDEIADVLLDQRVAAGIGNVYKSEVLWARRVSPFAPLSSLDGDVRRVLVDTAHRLLRANLGSGARETVPGGLGVYGRARQPCRRCGTPIRVRRQGPQVRSTYWCPRCQPEP